MTGTPTTHPLPSLTGAKSAAISNLTVRLLSQYTGRGPTKARTYINEDVITVVLRDTLTRAEVSLVDSHHREIVLSTRRTFQEVMGTANHIAPDIGVETFILASTDNGAPPSSSDVPAPASASMVRDGA